MKSKKSIKKFENVKDIIYNSAKVFADKIAFTTKVKNGSEVAYINHTYSDLLKDINSFGTSLYKLNLQNSRIAVVGANSYEWSVAHLSNLLRRYCFCPFR